MNLEEIRKALKCPVRFDEEKHRYFLKGKRLANVGSIVKQFKEPFDSDYWAGRKAKERGITKAAILAEWKAKGDVANAKGTRFHTHAQNRMLGKRTTCDTPEARAFDVWWEEARKNLEVVLCELILHTDEYGISGTADLLALSRKTGLLHIFDWKTNGKFETDSKYGKRLLPPFSHLPECSLSEYSLQVGLYRLMAEWRLGMRLGDSYIMHVGEVNPGTVNITAYKAHDVTGHWQQALKALKKI